MYTQAPKVPHLHEVLFGNLVTIKYRCATGKEIFRDSEFTSNPLQVKMPPFEFELDFGLFLVFYVDIGLFSKIKQISQISQTFYLIHLISPVEIEERGHRVCSYGAIAISLRNFPWHEMTQSQLSFFSNQVVQAHLPNYADFPNLALIKNVLDFIFELKVD